MHKTTSPVYGGIRCLLGCNPQALALYRISLGGILLLELLLRFRFLHPFYSDEGTLPTRLLIPKVDSLYRLLCIHLLSGSLFYQQCLLSLQALAATCLMIGYKTRFASYASWYLYLSLSLRNTWLNFILDRYFHYLLFYAMFLPLDQVWAVQTDSSITNVATGSSTRSKKIIVSAATIAIKLQVLWIYLDAGQGKYNDPLQGWTFHADPLPALDTYARHTLVARYMYALLGPFGLRLMTPSVVYVELFSVPLALIGTYFGSKRLVMTSIITMCSLHFGIALTIRNTGLLGSVACCAWIVFLPPFDDDDDHTNFNDDAKLAKTQTKLSSISKDHDDKSSNIISTLIILSLISGCVWFEIISDECNQSTKHIWSTLLHNRWNVFIGAEEYVTWEIAPGRLANGVVVDVWGRTETVDWNMPGTGAPCTSTSRPGRWRSYPYLAGLSGEDGEVLWSYLCKQWDHENGVTEENNERKLLRFNFFMLQADVLPNMGFSSTRKRLIHSHVCVHEEEEEEKAEGEENQPLNITEDSPKSEL